VDFELISGFVRTARRRPIFDLNAIPPLDLTRGDIERLLPHRDPFLLVDSVTHADCSTLAIAGRRRVDASDPVFRGHFPGDPIYPGVLQLEMMGQLGLCLFGLSKQADPTSRHPLSAVRVLKVHHAMYLAPVGPGDELVILAKILDWNDYTAIAAGQLLKGDTICSLGIMEVYFVGA
jgi:3-hydroxyacyl-[acyl-carrier-protein] dehydratase